MSFLPADIFGCLFHQLMSGVAKMSMEHIEITWSILTALSLVALYFLFECIQEYIAVLERASAEHHMITIRVDPQPLTVNKEVELS